MIWIFALYGLSCCFFYVATDDIKPMKGSNYLLLFNREEIFEKCDSHPNNFISKAFDISDLKFEYLADETIQIKGTIKFILDLPKKQKVVAEAEIYKKSRGQWVGTMYNMRRPDLCFSLFNPAEIWHPYAKLIAADMGTCPPKTGTTFYVNLVADPIVKGLQDRHADGEYKLRCKMNYGPKPSDVICFEMYFHAQKHE